jgi:uncharacterized cupredoxin-like copper-binding protein
MNKNTVAGAMLAAMAACALVTPAVAATTTPTEVKVELWNKADGSQGMTLNTDHVKAGKVKFEVTNSSSNMVHEFLILKTNMKFEDFPKDPENPAVVDEDKLKGVKELSSDLNPGNAGTLTMNLKPGRYVVFCNQPGHFDGGMHLVFTVTK